MKSFLHNSILQKSILCFLVVFALLGPVSVSLPSSTEETNTTSSGVTFTLHIAEAAVEDCWAEVVCPEAWIRDISLWLGNTLLSIAAAFTWFGGQLLHIATTELVFKMGANVNSQFGNAINLSWGIIRDICNLIFIFGFIYIGISTIIEPDKASTKRFLTKIIIGALLINFSLFIVKFIVDFANFLAVQIYSAMTTGSGSVSSKIADLLGIVEIYRVPDPAAFAELTDGGTFWFFVLGALFLLIAAFVFFMAAILLVVRFIALVLIMVFSPLLFAATVFPKTQSIASDLWSKLIGYAFFAPVYLLFILIAIQLLEGLRFMRGGNQLVNAFAPMGGETPQTGSFGVLLYFLIAAGFLIATTRVAHSMGIKGGEIAVKFAGGMSYGLAARMGRATIGRYAYNKSESDGLKDAASQRGLKGWGARQALKASRVVGDSSLDIRNAGAAGKALGAGAGMKGGYKTTLEGMKKKEDAFAKSLGEVGDDDVRVEARKKEMEHLHHEIGEHKDSLNDLKSKKQDAERDKKRSQEIISAAELRKESLQTALDTTSSAEEKKRLQEAIDEEETKIKDATQAISRHEATISSHGGAITTTKGTIEKLEDESKKAKITFENEKQRRILGSTFNTPSSAEIDELKKESKKANDEIKAAWNNFTHLGDNKAAKEKMLSDIEKLKKTYKEKMDKHDALVRKQMTDGYVNVIENSTVISTWPTGRLVSQQKSIAKSIRKKYEKGIPKEKDDHGGGGDHGGGDHGGGHGGDHHPPAAAPAPKPAAPAPAPAGGGGGDHGGGGHH